MAKLNLKRLITPAGMMIFPTLTTPDVKYVKDGGEYHTRFALDLSLQSTQDLGDELTAILNAYVEQQQADWTPKKIKNSKVSPVGEIEEDDAGEETGRIIYKFKLKAKIVTKNKSWDQAPRLFDAGIPGVRNPEPIPAGTEIWGGTVGKCKIEVFPYYMESTASFGLSLRIIGAQILKLVTKGGGSADDFGFGAEEGFTNAPEVAQEEAPVASASVDVEDDDDF